MILTERHEGGVAAQYFCDRRHCTAFEITDTAPGYPRVVPRGWSLVETLAGAADLCPRCAALWRQKDVTPDVIAWGRPQRLKKVG